MTLEEYLSTILSEKDSEFMTLEPSSIFSLEEYEEDKDE